MSEDELDDFVTAPEDDYRTLYQVAGKEMRRCIESYLQLLVATKGLSVVDPTHLQDETQRIILLAGLGLKPVGALPSAKEAAEEWKRRAAVPFDIEPAITYGVYKNIRKLSQNYLAEVESATNNFKSITAEFIQENPFFLPIFQHLGEVFSKAELKKLIGSASDRGISKPAATKLAELLNRVVKDKGVDKGRILNRLESTLEGIVRDLVGRVLLESLVATAFSDKKVSFQREAEYESLAGVVYDFRADFVLPDAKAPKAFVEVRKSSSRHASLYAKDKMFSAINWKGKNPTLLGVLVIDGEWTSETKRVMANVFDYVVPITKINEVAETIKAYVDGDKSKLKWLIDFKISKAN